MNTVVAVEMDEAQSLAFIEENLKKNLAAFGRMNNARGMRRAVDLPVDREKLEAAVLNSTLIAFPEGMSRRNKTIVKRTFLFADVSAMRKYPKKEDQHLRWDYTLLGMQAMGWAKFGSPRVSFQEHTSGVTMSNLVLDIIESAIGGVTGGVGAVMKAGTTAAIAGLKGNKEALTLYENNGKKADGSNFGMATCAVDKEGDVYLMLGGISYHATAGNTKIAFFEKTTSAFEFFQANSMMTIYEDDYTAKKEAAANKLYDEIDAILEMEFGI